MTATIAHPVSVDRRRSQLTHRVVTWVTVTSARTREPVTTAAVIAAMGPNVAAEAVRKVLSRATADKFIHAFGRGAYVGVNFVTATAPNNAAPTPSAVTTSTPLPAGSYVYVIGRRGTEGPVKIGTTTDLPARLMSLRSGKGAICPEDMPTVDLEVLHFHPGGRTLERELHERYAHSRIIGEWFNLKPADARAIIGRHIAEQDTCEAVQQRGTACHCHRCVYVYGPSRLPKDRTELANPDRRLLGAIHAMTHARLGVDRVDRWAFFPASHCDIDRAVDLLAVLDHANR